MSIPESIIDEIRNRADLVEFVSQVTPVTQRGSDYWACCPFHKEKTPSFKINRERQSYYCFGCKASGNIFSFIKQTVNTDFPGAVRWLADRLNIEIPEDTQYDGPEATRHRQFKDQCLRLLNDVAAWYHANLNTPESQAARNYITSRELDKASVDTFQLGYCPDSWDATITWAKRQGYTQEQLIATGLAIQKDNGTCYDRFRGRLTFPIWDELGRVVGFSARVLEQDAKTAKYVNTPETEFFHKGQILYGLHIARKEFKKAGYALICEGQLDTIACHRAGLTNTIASQGTAFTEEHAKILRRSTQNVSLSFDGDTAGQHATFRTIGLLHAQGISVKIVTIPSGNDPDGIFRTGGADALQAVMGTARSAVQYLLDTARNSYDLSDGDQLGTALQTILEVIAPISDPAAKFRHCQFLASGLNIPESVMMAELQRVEKRLNEKPTGFYRTSPQHASMTPPAFNPTAPSSGGVNIADPAMRGSAVRRAMPFKARTEIAGDKTKENILALILKFKEFANTLAHDEELSALLTNNTPLENAIAQVLAKTDLDEWETAESDIAQSQLSEDAHVGRVLNENDYEPLVPRNFDTADDAKDKVDRARQAFYDCLNSLRKLDIDTKIKTLQTTLRTAAPDEFAAVQSELVALLKKKQALLHPETQRT